MLKPSVDKYFTFQPLYMWFINKMTIDRRYILRNEANKEDLVKVFSTVLRFTKTG